MAGKDSGRRLVIVESPAKARTIAGYLGDGYDVEASVGHIRDLPNPSELPADMKKGPYGRFAVDVDNGFDPYYVVDPDKKKKVAELKRLLKDADELYLATDEDREGEAIAWHLLRGAQADGPGTPDGLPRDHPRGDPGRRQPDPRHRHADGRRPGDPPHPGPALRLRGLARCCGARSARASRPAACSPSRPAWSSSGSASGWPSAPRRTGTSSPMSPRRATATRASPPAWSPSRAAGSPPVATSPTPAELKSRRRRPPRRGDGRGDRRPASRRRRVAVRSVQEKPYTRRPAAPFTTSTLQQEASRKLRFSSKHAMSVAQRLYENGYITYMRTDSTTLSEAALSAARSQARELYGDEYVPAGAAPLRAQGQERPGGARGDPPAGDRFRTPAQVAGELRGDEFALYELIWKRTVASQMADAARLDRDRPARRRRWPTARDVEFSASGTVITFRGFLAAYEEGRDEDRAGRRRGARGGPSAAAAGRRATRSTRCRARRPTATRPARRRASPRRPW